MQGGDNMANIILAVIVILAISFVLACIAVKIGIVNTKKDPDEIKQKVHDLRTRLDNVLGEEAQRLDSYNVTACIRKGQVTYLSVATKKTEGIIERSEGSTKYSLRDLVGTPWGVRFSLTICLFILISLIVLLLAIPC